MTADTTDWKAIIIDDAGLAPRAVKALAAAGISTLGEIDSMSDVELVRVRDLGRMQMRAVRERIAAIGKRNEDEAEKGDPTAEFLDGLATYLHRLGDVIRREVADEQMHRIDQAVGEPERIAEIVTECARSIRNGGEPPSPEKTPQPVDDRSLP